MKTISMMATAGNRLPAVEWAGALAAVSFICASCASPAPADISPSEKAGTLEVTVIEAGGPALPSAGGTQQRPLANAVVKVTSTGTNLSSLTDKAGVATFRLPNGSYLVSSPTCGSTGTLRVTVTAPGPTSLTWICPIP